MPGLLAPSFLCFLLYPEQAVIYALVLKKLEEQRCDNPWY
jgi:hypothetical protein